MGSLPRWVWIVALGSLLLLAPLLWIDPAASKPRGESLSDRDEQRVQSLVQVIREGDMLEARRRADSSLEKDYPPEVLPRLLQAIQTRHLNNEITRDGLFLLSDFLQRLVREDIVTEDFEFHFRRLRHQALLSGGKELLAEVADPLMRSQTLALYSPDSRLDVVDHAILFERWDEAFAAFGKLPFDRFREHPSHSEGVLLPLRTLARIASAGRIPEAREALETLLKEEADLLGSTPQHAARTRHWLEGVRSLYARDRGTDRGSRALERAVDPLDLSPAQVLFRLDLAEALRSEARHRQDNLADESLPFQGDKARKAFLVGWGAIRLRDEKELAESVALLAANPGGRDGVEYQRLLLGAHEIVTGLKTTGEARIRRALERNRGLLAPEHLRTFEALAAGQLPTPVEHPGPLLFDTGKFWAELRRPQWLNHTLTRLRGEISAPRDLTYLKFLEALRDFRSDHLTEARSKLLELLDGELPAELTRGEIAALLVLSEARESDLEAIASRRDQALEVLAEVISAEDQGRLPAQLARLLKWQIHVEREGPSYLESPEGAQLFNQIREDVSSPWLDFLLLEKWLELEDDLLALSRQQYFAGDLDASLATLTRCRELGRDLPRYLKQEGRVLREYAKRGEETHPDDIATIRQQWLRCAEAFETAAQSTFGDRECFYDAAEAFLFAGDAERSAQALEQYTPNRSGGADGEKRHWQTIVYRARSQRLLGNIREAETIVENVLNHVDLGSHRYPLLMERGLCREARGDVDGSLEDYSVVYAELLPTSEDWLDALYRKARILQRLSDTEAATSKPSGDGSPDGGAVSLANLRETSLVWEELASRLRERPKDSRRAEALFRAGEARVEFRELKAARDRFQGVVSSAEAILDQPLDPRERKRWEEYYERSSFGLADALFLSGNFTEAGAHYERAVSRFPFASLVPFGYYQLGECALKRGRKDDAIRFYQLGERKVIDLPEMAFQDLPLQRGREFWLRNFREKVRLLANTKEQ